MIVALIAWLLYLYLFLIFARIVLSWFPLSPDGPMAGVARVLFTLTEPVLGPLRSMLPPVQIGGAGLDLSPLIVLFVILLILRLIGG
jgi:YggT family protein